MSERQITSVTLHLYWFDRLRIIVAKRILGENSFNSYLVKFVNERVSVEVLDK